MLDDHGSKIVYNEKSMICNTGKFIDLNDINGEQDLIDLTLDESDEMRMTRTAFQKSRKMNEKMEEENRKLRRIIVKTKKKNLNLEMKFTFHKSQLMEKLKTKTKVIQILKGTIKNYQEAEKKNFEKIEEMDKKIVLLTKELMNQERDMVKNLQEEDMGYLPVFDDCCLEEEIKMKSTPQKKGPSPSRKKTKKSTSPMESPPQKVVTAKSTIETPKKNTVRPNVRKLGRKSARKSTSKKKK